MSVCQVKRENMSLSLPYYIISPVYLLHEKQYVLYCLHGYKKETNKHRGYIIYLYCEVLTTISHLH
jgi:hypothetical protein